MKDLRVKKGAIHLRRPQLLGGEGSDALELKFGEPSRAELEIFRAEPSRAGCL